MAAVFWTLVVLVAYIYVGYPAAARLVGAVRGRRVDKKPLLPSVTIVIAAYNEEKHIEKTLENKLALDYPRDRLEIVVVSDGSTDGTDAVAGRFRAAGVRLLRQEPRQGKTAALNMAVREAKGDLIVFSDANSLYSEGALRELAQNFADATVGYVTGKMVYARPDGSVVGDGCTAFMRYENRLRAAETRIGSIVGVNGGIDAVRRGLYEPMRADQLPDFVLPLKVVERGFRVVFEPAALLKEDSLKTAHDEYGMRVRVALRAFHALRDMAGLLNPLRFGLFSFQLFSHKLLRYMAFVFLAGAYGLGAALSTTGPFYAVLFAGQTIFYLGAVAGWRLQGAGGCPRALYAPFYFGLLNLASAHAFVKFVKGERRTTWEPRKG